MAARFNLVKIYSLILSALLPPSDKTDEIAAFVASSIRLAPFHLRMGVRVAEAALLFWLVFTARGFAQGKPEIESLRASLDKFEKLHSVTATLIRLYRSLGLLAWFERKEAA